MTKRKLKIENLLNLGFWLAAIVIICVMSTFVFKRFDLTSEKRYTLSEPTRELLADLDDVVYFRVYLDGELPSGFRRFRRAILEMLDEFRVIGGQNIQYEFVNPTDQADAKARDDFFMHLYEKGLHPTNVDITDIEGGRSQKIIFPGALVTYKGLEMPVNLLKNNPARSADENLHNSIQALEYEFASAVYSMASPANRKIAFIEGHGELDEMLTGDIMKELSLYYDVYRGRIDASDPGILDDYDALIIAKPEDRFAEPEKYMIDQYIMKGGNVLWFIDPVAIDLDSLTYASEAIALLKELNLEDQLFRYGIRINPDLIMDMNCVMIPVNVALSGEQPRFDPAPWYFSPLLRPDPTHPVTRGINPVKGEFVSSIDLLEGNPDVEKTVLLRSSDNSRVVNAPLVVSLDMARRAPDPSQFNMGEQVAAVLLEGRFRSVFTNRMIEDIIGRDDPGFIGEGSPASMIVVSDGDIIRNDVRIESGRPEPLPLGYDRYSGQTFGNKDFVMNAVSYLLDDAGLMDLRTRELSLRLLDRPRVREEKLKWQIINVFLPVLFVLLFGLIFNISRKKRFAK